MQDRRKFLGLAAAAPFAAISAGKALAADAACYNPASLPSSQKSLRESLEYEEISAAPKKHCALCAFFTASTTGCGNCQLLSGPVTASSSCSSFAARP